MLIRQLTYLAALARERHFGRAARACHVSQPTLSSGIRRLEAELGVQIVQRSQRFEGFTYEGERVLGWAQRILADCEGLKDDLGSMRHGLSGRLRLGAIPTSLPAVPLLAAGAWAPEVVGACAGAGRVVVGVAPQAARVSEALPKRAAFRKARRECWDI